MSIALALVVVEGVLRALGRDRAVHVPDPVLGWRLNPGFADWITEENRVFVRINRDALRDRDHPLVAERDTVRIAVLGDSYMEASNLPFEQTFPALLEGQLMRCLAPSGRRAEVVNFGVSGYGTAQELLMYRHHARRYRPDIVLLSVYTSNDILDNSATLNEDPGSDRPYFVMRGDQLVQARARRPEEAHAGLPLHQRWRLALTERSLAANLLWGGWSELRAAMIGRPPAPAVPDADANVSQDTSQWVLIPPQNEAMRDAWRVTEELFSLLSREVAADGSEFWMTTLSMGDQTDPRQDAREHTARTLGIESLYYPDDRISAFAQAHGIPLISLVRPLAEYAAKHGVFLNGGYNALYPAGSGHWNATAHTLAAGIVGERLCAESGAIAAR